MNASKLKGKTIRKVHQERRPIDRQSARPGAWLVTGIEFTDGTWLRFVVVEGDFEHGVEGVYPARGV